MNGKRNQSKQGKGELEMEVVEKKMQTRAVHSGEGKPERKKKGQVAHVNSDRRDGTAPSIAGYI